MPRLEPLAPDVARAVVTQALDVLCDLGVAIHDRDALTLLADHGAAIDTVGGRARLPHDLVERALATAPAVVRLFDTRARLTHEIGGEHQYFTPGSTATRVLDRVTGDARPPTTADYVEYVKVVSGLPHLCAQSTAFVPADVPAQMSDSYRLYLSLLYGEKPVVTGTFSAASLAVMTDLQLAVRNGIEALASCPLTIFSCCPTSPLAWSEDATRTLMGCARSGNPVELVPMGLSGFIAPVSLAGTLVQHTAEALSGVVLSQLARPGAPVLFGGASTVFDVRYETAPMGAVESMLLACGTAQIGRALELPTQAYIALSDSRALDVQGGIESAMGATLAALSGINEVSGPGMLDFGNCFSVDKLVIDDEICALAGRARAGIAAPQSRIFDVIEELLRERHLLIAADTRQHLREEIFFPGPLIDRASHARWLEDGKRTLSDRIEEQIAALVRRYEMPERDEAVTRTLTDRMRFEARRCGLEHLPELPCAT